MVFPLFASALGLAEFVPLIAKWVSGEGGESAAQKILNIAKEVTQQDTHDDVMTCLRQDAQALLAFQREVRTLEAEMDKAYLSDRQNARARDVSLKASGSVNKRSDIMVVSAAAGLVLCLGSLGYYADHLPGEAVGIISTIAGIFGACLKDAYAFEFGSSRGSKEKDTSLAQLMDRG